MAVCEDPPENPRVIADRVRAEYLEMPGLNLTAQQAARLLGLDYLRAAAALDELRRDAFLVCNSKAQFVRRDTTMRRERTSAALQLVDVA